MQLWAHYFHVIYHTHKGDWPLFPPQSLGLRFPMDGSTVPWEKSVLWWMILVHCDPLLFWLLTPTSSISKTTRRRLKNSQTNPTKNSSAQKMGYDDESHTNANLFVVGCNETSQPSVSTHSLTQVETQSYLQQNQYLAPFSCHFKPSRAMYVYIIKYRWLLLAEVRTHSPKGMHAV